LSDTPLAGTGCAFRDRCPQAFARCAAETPALRSVGPGRAVACHLSTSFSEEKEAKRLFPIVAGWWKLP
jgi:hypothetical protein